MDPEGIRRAATFADLARRPTIVGGHMFSMYDRSLLHAFAEAIAPQRWWWGVAPNTKGRHDFARRNLRNTPWLHRRADSDYNGWWMCLIPTRVISEIGLALPVFIKWDDAEYGVRAREAGYPTVSMPGVAAWHVPWDDKNDARDWQAYYHLRNRIIAGLLHSQQAHGGSMINESLERQLQNLLSMQYSTAALRLLAIEDVLSGPAHLHRDIGTKMKELRELRAQYADAQDAADIESFPPARRRAPEAVKDSTTPTNKRNLLTKAGAGTARQFRKPRPGARQRPQLALPYQDASWWVLVKLDSALVSTADGTSAAWYQRDPKLFRSLGRRSLLAHLRLRRQWARLAAEYRAAAPEFTSPQRGGRPSRPPSRPRLAAGEPGSHAAAARPVARSGRAGQLSGWPGGHAPGPSAGPRCGATFPFLPPPRSWPRSACGGWDATRPWATTRWSAGGPPCSACTSSRTCSITSMPCTACTTSCCTAGWRSAPARR